MTKLFYVMAIFFVTTKIIAQDYPFKFEKSEVFKDDYSDSEIVLAEKINNDNFLIVRTYKNSASVIKGYYIEKYNNSLCKISDFDLEVEQSSHQKQRLILGSLFSQSKLYIIEMFYDLKVKSYVCLASIIDEQYNVTKRELFKLHRDEIKGFGLQGMNYSSDFNQRNLGLFEIEEKLSYDFVNGLTSSKVSDNRSRSEVILKVNNSKSLFSIAMAYKHEDKDFTKIFLFDSDLNKKFDYQFSNEKDMVVNQNLELHDSEGAIFLTQKVFPDELKSKNDGGKYIYQIKKITKEGIISKAIDVENHYVTSITTFCLENKLYSVGFYSDKGNFKYGGISFFELNAQNLEIVKSSYSEFTEEFMVDKYGKIKNRELKHIVINSLHINSENQIYINAEEVYRGSKSRIIDSGNRVVYDGSTMLGQKFYEDIITILLSNNGEIIKARNINKLQIVASEGEASFLSYSSFLLNDVNYFFVNAKDKIKELSGERVEFRSASIRSNLNLFVISVDNKGNVDYKKLLDKNENEVPFMVAAGIKLDNSMIFLGSQGKKKQLLKVGY